MYTAAVGSSGQMTNENRDYLAQNASAALRQWVDYALQHNIKVPYSSVKKEEAEASAQDFYSSARRGALVDANFQKMWEESILLEEQLQNACPWLPRRARSAQPISMAISNSNLRPNAPPFCPRGLPHVAGNNSPGEDPADQKRLLDEYFTDITSSNIPSPRTYSDDEIAKVAHLLQHVNGGIWSKNPRLYIVLRRIGLLEMCKVFLEDNKITDANFPFTENYLPDVMDKSQQCAFIQMQNCVLTKGPAATKCEDGGHAHFADPVEIPFRRDGILGSGGYAQVEKVTSKNTGKEYARKLLDRRALQRSHGSLFQFDNELKILKRLRHQHVVQVVGSYTEPQFVAIIMSPIADCDLSNFLETKATPPHSVSLLRTFPGCLATALRYLHQEEIRHKDIKPSNILVKDCTILLTDFGLARDCNNAGSTTSRQPGAFTLRYSAKEVVDGGKRSYPSDMWSLGCVFLEIFTVIQGIRLSEMTSYFQNNGSKTTHYWNNLQSVSHWIRRLGQLQGPTEPEGPIRWVQQLLQQDISKRPSASLLATQIYMHRSATNRVGEFCGICCRRNAV